MYDNAHDTLERMIELNWSTNWSELPTEAEKEVEHAYEHLAKARDIVENEQESDI